MTHADLVERAGRWLAGTKRCVVVATEIVSACAETPDAIGWYMGNAILVECKASRGDFLADARKSFRQHPPSGLGAYRYYMTPPGLVSPKELPDRWGLVEVHANGVRVIRESQNADGPWGVAFPERNHRGETTILVSLLRRERGEYTRETHRTTIAIVPEEPAQAALDLGVA